MPPASLQTFIDTPEFVLEDRVQYSTVHIPNVFCFTCFLYCNRQVRREAWITLYNRLLILNKVMAQLLNVKLSPQINMSCRNQYQHIKVMLKWALITIT